MVTCLTVRNVYIDVRGQSPLDKVLEYLDDDDGCMGVALYLMSRGCVCGDEDKAKLLCRACERGVVKELVEGHNVGGKLGVVKELVERHNVDPKSECDDLFKYV